MQTFVYVNDEESPAPSCWPKIRMAVLGLLLVTVAAVTSSGVTYQLCSMRPQVADEKRITLLCNVTVSEPGNVYNVCQVPKTAHYLILTTVVGQNTRAWSEDMSKTIFTVRMATQHNDINDVSWKPNKGCTEETPRVYHPHKANLTQGDFLFLKSNGHRLENGTQVLLVEL